MTTKTLTRVTKAGKAEAHWYVVDARGKVLGRMATKVAELLMGKGKPNYDPSQEMGDHVVVLNAKVVAVTGKKESKAYYRHSGYPGGLKETDLETLRKTDPERIIRNAVSGMLPKNRLRDRRLANLHVFAGEEHQFEDRKPQEVDLG